MISKELCVVLQMPPVEEVKTSEYLRQLTAQTHSREFWEVGASCNFLIAAARMGLNTAAVANLGEDTYGQFLLDVLKVVQGSAHSCSLLIYCADVPCQWLHQYHLYKAMQRKFSCLLFVSDCVAKWKWVEGR